MMVIIICSCTLNSGESVGTEITGEAFTRTGGGGGREVGEREDHIAS